MKRLISATVVTLCCVSTAFAADNKDSSKPPKGMWDDSNLQLGYNANTGNSSNTSFITKLLAVRKGKVWVNSFKGSAEFDQSDGTTTAERYETAYEVDYKLNQYDFLYGRGNFTKDNFSPYKYDTTVSSGYGRRIFDWPAVQLDMQAGPGVRYTEASNTGQTDTEPVASGAALFSWAINDHSKFVQSFLTNMGANNIYTKAESDLNVKVIKHVSIVLSFRMEYNSSIPDGSDNTKHVDTTTNVNIAYNVG